MSTERAREVLFQVIGLVAPDIEPAALDPQSPLRDQADLDSMDFMEMVALLSDALHADIPEVDYPRLDTVDTAVAYLSDRLA